MIWNPLLIAVDLTTWQWKYVGAGPLVVTPVHERRSTRRPKYGTLEASKQGNALHLTSRGLVLASARTGAAATMLGEQ